MKFDARLIRYESVERVSTVAEILSLLTEEIHEILFELHVNLTYNANYCWEFAADKRNLAPQGWKPTFFSLVSRTFFRKEGVEN